MENRKSMEKIDETESWFFEKLNRISKPLATLIRKETEKMQMISIRIEKGEKMNKHLSRDPTAPLLGRDAT